MSEENMNDESKDLNARTSKCWNCKHGMCVNEDENQTVFAEGNTPHLGESTIFPEEDDEEIGPGELFTQFLTAKRVQAICYWHPTENAAIHPVRVAHVTQCSRYTPNGTSE